jgi:uncharacterized small protein (DUF1192 family)
MNKTISLNKALKLKNRLVGKISNIEDLICAYNSVEAGAERFDTLLALALHKLLKGNLVELKSKITLANAPVQNTIYRITELKSDITLLEKVPSKQGTFSNYGSDEKVTYVAKLTKQELDQRIALLQKEIDDLQDKLDEYNGHTTIEVNEGLLTSATGALPKEWYQKPQ